MIATKILESASIRELYRHMIENRLSRKALFGLVSKRLYQELVIENADDRPPHVQELKHAYMMALFQGFDRAMTRGHVSRRVTERLLDTVLEHVIVNGKKPATTGPHPLLLVVSPTGRCNIRCRGCYAGSDAANRGSLSFEIFDRILAEKRELWDSHLTIVSGGEPFLWHDGARGLLDLVERHPTEFFMPYTNGTLITDDVAQRMGELGNISPAVSLEGFEKETDDRRGDGMFKKILGAFESLRSHGVPFGVSVTPTRLNWETVTSDRFIDFCFEGQGAVFAWSFQYMPIGREPDLDLMLTAEDRLEMLRRTNRLVREKKVLFADFWNSGIASYGCISAGRPGGHFYINWNGDVMPCVFIPYAVDNIYDVYARGDNLNTVRETAFFRKIRRWQDEFGFTQPAQRVQNWLSPCPMRDHFDMLRAAAIETGARPINEEAAHALRDPGFVASMTECGREYDRLSKAVWNEEFAHRPAAEAPSKECCLRRAPMKTALGSRDS
jgi:MoaA/NifB/PqqE/SkfB family radical SAM enzyme